MKNTIYSAVCFILCFCLVFLTSCGNGGSASKSAIAKNAAVLKDIENAYIFGFPLVLMYVNERVMTNPAAGSANMPLNRFSNKTVPEAKDATMPFPDADFFCSDAWIELSAGPLVLEIPDTGGRYALFTVMDAWANIIASPGKRTTGTKAQKYLITPHGWEGTVPENMSRIKSTTNMAYINGRIQINSKDDGIKNVIPLQKKLKIIPLSRYNDKDYEPADKKFDNTISMSDPVEQLFAMDISAYFNLLNALMSDNRPYGIDIPFLESIEYLKIAPGMEFDLSVLNSEQQKAAGLIPDTVKKKLENKALAAERAGGWLLIGEAQSSRDSEYENRAVNVYNDIKIDLPEDVSRMRSFADADGEQFSGQNKYTMHFDADTLAPVNAFWSVTAYNEKSLFCVNALNRYSVSGSKTLKKNKDGSLDIYIQRENPGKEKESNWLPVSQGRFSLMFRAYWPKDEIIQKQWKIPHVSKVSK